MAERVLGGRLGRANPKQRGHVQPERIAYVVQAQGVTDLRVHHRHNVTPRGKRSCLFIDTGFPRKLRHEMVRNELADLAQHGSVLPVRLYIGFWFHTLSSDRSKTLSRTSFFPTFSQIPVGR
jgi:hypothetical protein